MNTSSNQKRLDKIEAALKGSTYAETKTVTYKLRDVANLDQAIKRAKKTGAHYVWFVPLTGDIQEAGFEPLNPALTPGTAVAFEGPEPTTDQLIRFVEWFERRPQSVEKTKSLAGTRSITASEANREEVWHGSAPGRSFCALGRR